MTLNEFTDRAVGVPFVDRGRTPSGWDCWGLIVNAYQECYGIVVPGYENISALDSREAGQMIDQQKKLWVEIPIGKEHPGDVIVLRHGTWPCHVGLIVKPGFMLHVDLRIDTCVEAYNTAIWKTQVIGIYRHHQKEITK
jgi:cell wall-associated NlpC family hydrolase